MQHLPKLIMRISHATFLHSPKLGAITQLYAGTSPNVTMKESGGYFIPWARIDKQATKEADDSVFCGKVIDLIERQIKEFS